MTYKKQTEKNPTKFKPTNQLMPQLKLQSGGGLAEYAIASPDLTAILPPTIPPSEAAGLPVAALTALQSLRYAGVDLRHPNPNQPKNILITAASGGVGQFATQLAKLAGLHVTATCGSRNIQLIESLGADEVLDYQTPEGAGLRSPSGKKYDAVIHCAAGIGWKEFEDNLAEGGRVVDLNPGLRVMVNSVLQRICGRRKRVLPLMLLPERRDLEFVVGLVEEGKLRTVVDSRFRLGKAEEAWAKCRGGHATGKIIVEM